MSQLQREKCVTGWWAIGMSYLCTPGMTSNLRLANASTFNTLLHDVAWCYMPLLTVGIVSRTVFFFEANDSSSRQLTGSRPDMAGRTARWDTGVATSRPAWSLDHRPCVHREHREHGEHTNHYQRLPNTPKQKRQLEAPRECHMNATVPSLKIKAS